MLPVSSPVPSHLRCALRPWFPLLLAMQFLSLSRKLLRPRLLRPSNRAFLCPLPHFFFKSSLPGLVTRGALAPMWPVPSRVSLVLQVMSRVGVRSLAGGSRRFSRARSALTPQAAGMVIREPLRGFLLLPIFLPPHICRGWTPRPSSPYFCAPASLPDLVAQRAVAFVRPVPSRVSLVLLVMWRVGARPMAGGSLRCTRARLALTPRAISWRAREHLF